MAFDPDAFLADKPQPDLAPPGDQPPTAPLASAFDPDAFLANKPQPALEAKAEIPSAAEAANQEVAEAMPKPEASSPEVPPDGETPGFWSSIGSAYSKGLAEQAASDIAGTKILLPKGMGGSSFEEQRQDGVMHPDTKDAIDQMIEEPLSQGWSDPKWWATQLAKGAGNITPGLGVALAAGAVGGPVAGVAAFALESGLSRFLPAYNAARAKGQDPNDAIKTSLIDTGITTAFATAMGFAPAVPVGRLAGSLINETMADLLSRPMAEAMIGIGAVQPSLMASQDIVTDLSHGESPNAEQALTDVVLGTVTGLGIHEVWRGAEGAQALFNAHAEMMNRPAPHPASEAVAREAAESQRAPEKAELKPEGTPSLGPPPQPTNGQQYDIDITPRRGSSQFFSAVKDAVINKMPDNMNAASVLNFLAKQPYVTRGEIAWLGLKDFLKGYNGQVPKDDLLAHIESREVQLKEVKYQDAPQDPMQSANDLYDLYTARYGTDNINQWPIGSQRHFNNVKEAALAATREVRYQEPKYRAQNPPDIMEPKEFVLSVPPPELRPEDVDAKAQELWNQKNVRRFGPWEEFPEGTDKERFREGARRQLYAEDPRVYTGTHYSEPNAFAHFRTGTYIDHNGRVLLGLMEAQADIHQEAARTGREYQEYGALDPNKELAATDAARTKYEAALKEREDALRAQGKSSTMAVVDPGIKALRDAWHSAADRFEQANRGVIDKAPRLPFKTEWKELVAKRMLQMVADSGGKYDGVFWLNGDQVGLRLDKPEQVKAARKSYGSDFNNIFAKWAKKVGSYTEPTRINAFQRDWEDHINKAYPPFRRDQIKALHLDNEAMKVNMFMPVGVEHSAVISKGMPMWDTDVVASHPAPGTRTLSEVVQDNPNWPKLLPVAKQIDKLIGRMLSEFRISRPVSFTFEDQNAPWRGRLREGWDPLTGNYVIDVNMRRILTAHDLYAAISHEFGHVLYKELYEKASDVERAALNKAYDDFRAKIPNEELTVADVRRIRDNAISETTGARDAGKDLRISDLDPQTKRYLLGKFEWWAEQVAKWMTTDEKPLKLADKFFKRVANTIRKMMAAFTKTEYGPNAKPDKAVQDFLDNKYGMKGTWMEPPDEQFEMDTKKKAQAAFNKEGAPETKAVPQQASTGGGRDIISKLPPGDKSVGEAMAAHGDRMNWFYNYFTSLPQIASLNKHLKDLAEYADMHRAANLMKNEIMSGAQDRDRQWAAIRDPKELEKLTNFISDYATGKIKKDVEDGIHRRPTSNEFMNAVKEYGLSDQSVRMFQTLQKAFDGALDQYRNLLIKDAWKIKNAKQRQITMQNINSLMDKLLREPFMPLTRFGKYSITVFGHDNKVRHYETTNSLRRQKQIAEVLEKHPDRLPGDKVVTGMVPKDVVPFLGMPPGLINLMSEKLSLSDTQRAMLDQLKFDYAPAQTFKHQFRNLDLTPGWSTDYRRAHAHFFFHFANHYTRINWVDKMRDSIAKLGSVENRVARAGQPGGANKLDKIVKYAQGHLDAFLDPKSDWAAARGLMFHWYLGFNPASAVVNLTQTPLMTHPYLASWFGDFASARSILKASTDLNNFYRKTTLLSRAEAAKGVVGREAAQARALGTAVKYGILSETQAHELAALAEDRNLLRIFGTKAEQFWLKFQEASSWMFEASEQWNRRVAFRAAWDLAYDHPGHGLIKEAVNTYPLLFKQLTDINAPNGAMQGHEAGAFLAAMRAVDQSQFTYAPYARPPIMRGKIGSTALVFKLFTQNSMFNIISNPSMAWRWALTMAALGGMQGLMGFDNVNSLLKTIAYRAFGKDFDLEDEARHFAHDVLNDVIPPDMLMHGLSAKGFGIPMVMHSMGVPFPTVDLSKSVGLGDVLGFDPFKPLGPVKQPKDEEFRQLSRATGAAFGLPLSLYDFASSNDNLTDLKRYESVMPRFFGNLSHAYRFFAQGAEVNRAGNAVVKFDPADTEQMMEILARAAGFQPRRLTEEWGRIQATAEAAAYWDLRRQGLLRQFADTIRNSDAEGKERVREAIKLYNQTLPPEARGKVITGPELISSIEQRMRVKRAQESGLPAQKSNIPIAKDIEKYYPRGFPPDLQSAKRVQ